MSSFFKILLIDDDRGFCDDFVDATNSTEKYTTTFFCDVEEALSHYQSLSAHEFPDLIIIDVELRSELNGFDVVEKISHIDDSTPIAIITSLPSNRYAFLAGRYKVIDFITKEQLISDSSYIQMLDELMKRVEIFVAKNQEEKTKKIEDTRIFVREFIHDFMDILLPIEQSLETIVENCSQLDMVSLEFDEQNLFDEVDVEAKAGLEVVRLGVEVVDHLRDFVESGRYQLRPTEVRVESLISACCALCLSTEKNVEIECADLVAFIDEGALQRIIRNILKNVEQHLDLTATVKIVAEKVVLANETRLRVRVSDNGPGVPTKVAATIFEPFIKHPVIGEREGSGLGLSIAKRYTELHRRNSFQGVISCRRCPALGGAEFEVLLPIGGP